MHYSKDIEQIYKMKNKESLILKYKNKSSKNYQIK